MAGKHWLGKERHKHHHNHPLSLVHNSVSARISLGTKLPDLRGAPNDFTANGAVACAKATTTGNANLFLSSAVVAPGWRWRLTQPILHVYRRSRGSLIWHLRRPWGVEGLEGHGRLPKEVGAADQRIHERPGDGRRRHAKAKAIAAPVIHCRCILVVKRGGGMSGAAR